MRKNDSLTHARGGIVIDGVPESFILGSILGRTLADIIKLVAQLERSKISFEASVCHMLIDIWNDELDEPSPSVRQLVPTKSYSHLVMLGRSIVVLKRKVLSDGKVAICIDELVTNPATGTHTVEPTVLLREELNRICWNYTTDVNTDNEGSFILSATLFDPHADYPSLTGRHGYVEREVLHEYFGLQLQACIQENATGGLADPFGVICSRLTRLTPKMIESLRPRASDLDDLFQGLSADNWEKTLLETPRILDVHPFDETINLSSIIPDDDDEFKTHVFGGHVYKETEGTYTPVCSEECWCKETNSSGGEEE